MFLPAGPFDLHAVAVRSAHIHRLSAANGFHAADRHSGETRPLPF